jgi:NADPH:quinone reductase-like Zn-dependent oxidoreductase
MKAYVTEGSKGVVKQVPLPKYKRDELLVKNFAVAINPTDWKHVDPDQWAKMGKEGNIVGCDLAGEVVEVGSDVTDWKKGDQVFAFVPGANYYRPDNGAFAEYTAVVASKAFKPPVKLTHNHQKFIPVGPIDSFEGAASTPVALLTVITGFEHFARIHLKPDPKRADEYFLVWGGASSLGQITIQLAKFVGFKVIVTASQHNWENLTKLGAEKCFDYRQEDVLDQIKKYAGDHITVAFDTITSPPTSADTYELLSTTKPSTLIVSLPFDETNLQHKKPNVKVVMPLAYLATDPVRRFGVKGEEMKAPHGLHESAAHSVAHFNKLMAENPNFIRHMPIAVLPNGFDNIDDGLDLSRQGKVSGEKIVIRLV